MKLRELPNTVIRCTTGYDYDRLMRVFEEAGWRWPGGTATTWSWTYRVEHMGDSMYIRCNSNCSCFPEGDLQKYYPDVRVLSVSEFLRDQGVEKTPKIELGKKYRPKTGRSSDLWRAAYRPAYIMARSFNCGNGFSACLDIYNAEGRKIGECDYCFNINDLESYEEPKEETLRAEALRPGDWVEVIETFDDGGVGNEFISGRTYRVGSVEPSSIAAPVTLEKEGGYQRGIWKYNVCNLRKCPPPEPRKEEPATHEYTIPADILKPGIHVTLQLSDDGRHWKTVRPVTNVKPQPLWKRSPSDTAQPPSCTARADDTSTSSQHPSMSVVVGGKYRPKPKGERRTCGTYDGRPDAACIVVTEIIDAENLRYDILDGNGNKIDECCYCLKVQDLISDSPIPTPSLIMKVIQATTDVIDYVRLGADEKLLRECQYKDSDGKWTQLAKDVFFNEMFKKDAEAVLLPLAKEIQKAQEKDKKCC